MAVYTGYVTIPHDTYEAWKNATNGNGYDFDSTYGLQCYDLVAEFWWNIGFPPGYPVAGGTEYAYMIWDDRTNNVSYNGVTYFDLIYSINDVKKGDIIVYSPFSGNAAGHVGFAAMDYNGTQEFPILSQNNSGEPYPGGGSYVNIHGYDVSLFRGAFRYRGWQTTPPTPGTPTYTSKHRFPWVLYARKLREKY